ncbi:hypothetical protein ABRP17_010195 [Stenotrophomonas sp. WHRI 8082]|uniref:hypothetical protein n=1 Tax=Stenotrophomonas sp. WHRI 8082 TaxID=3162571 RepID=UPI0032EE6734
MSPDYQIPGRVPDDGVQRDTFSTYWRERYPSEPYFDANSAFDEYEPAYRLGHQSRAQDVIRAYEEVERELETRWAAERGESRLEWLQARHAVKRGWEDALLADPRLGKDPKRGL